MSLRLVALSIASLSVAFGCTAGTSPSPAPAGLVRVAAASDLRFALDSLIERWTTEHADITVVATYGSSGNLYAQISEGAPFDAFFSADVSYPRALEEAGFADPGSTRLYGIGQIVVWARAAGDAPTDLESRGLDALTSEAVRTVAIANPEHAPYGQAAMAALESTGLLEAVRPKLVLGENVSQAAQFVDSGNADAGIIALSLAVSPALVDRGRYSIVPTDVYPPLEQGVVLLDAAVDPGAGQAFIDFVLGPEGRAVLDRYGFLAPPS